jgi:hypothetical protein
MRIGRTTTPIIWLGCAPLAISDYIKQRIERAASVKGTMWGAGCVVFITNNLEEA